MFKSYSILLLSLVLTLSILAPAVLSFINDNCEIVLIECNEEDSEEKEIEAFDNEEGEEEKSIRLLYASLRFNKSFVLNKTISTTVFIDRVSAPELEIQLPPPENLM